MAEINTHLRERELATMAIAGDNAAFEELVIMNYGRVYFSALNLIKDSDSAHDLTQDVLLRIWLNIQKLKSPDRFGHWLARVTRNQALNWIRIGQRKSKLVSLVPLEDGPENKIEAPTLTSRQHVENQEFSSQLWNAVHTLPEVEREIILLHYCDELSVAEIARFTGEHISTISRRLERAHKKLRSFWDEGQLAGLACLKPDRKRTAATLAVIAAAARMPAPACAAVLKSDGQIPLPRASVVGGYGGWMGLGVGVVVFAIVILGANIGLFGKPKLNRYVASDGKQPSTLQGGLSARMDLGSAATAGAIVAQGIIVSENSKRSGSVKPADSGTKAMADVPDDDKPGQGNSGSILDESGLKSRAMTVAILRHAAGYGAETSVSSRKSTRTVDLNVVGQVVDELGNPHPEAYVNAQVISAHLEAKVNADGSFGFPMKPSYSGVITAWAPGYAPAFSWFHVPDSGLRLVLDSKGSTIIGQVVDQDGKPVAGALVGGSAFTTATDSEFSRSVCMTSSVFSSEIVACDQQGNFTLSRLPHLGVKLFAAAPGEKRKLWEAARMNESLTKVDLTKRDVLSGVVLKLPNALPAEASGDHGNGKPDNPSGLPGGAAFPRMDR